MASVHDTGNEVRTTLINQLFFCNCKYPHQYKRRLSARTFCRNILSQAAIHPRTPYIHLSAVGKKAHNHLGEARCTHTRGKDQCTLKSSAFNAPTHWVMHTSDKVMNKGSLCYETNFLGLETVCIPMPFVLCKYFD